MKKCTENIVVYEHSTLYANREGCTITKEQLKKLQTFYGGGLPYYSLINNGIKFCQYVGVLQVGNTTIEVLPKADNNNPNAGYWRSALIDMLRVVKKLNVSAPSNSNLKLKPNAILHFYFELFIVEVEQLLHQGLAKKYHKIEENLNSLKGSLNFSKHIQHNFIHQERFYTRFTTYDTVNLHNTILYKAIKLLTQINSSPDLQGRISSLLLNFPEMPDVNINESTFDKLTFNRKTERYRKAIEIAKLLLLNYHPDVTSGRNHVLAIMIDMNKLWEQFVYICIQNKIKEHKIDFSIYSQAHKHFWKSEKGHTSSMRPDIVVENNKNKKTVVLDTKWKNLQGNTPSPEDLRQMFAYHVFYKAERVALIYPGNGKDTHGYFLDNSNKCCSTLEIEINNQVKIWQQDIYNKFIEWSMLHLT